MRNKQLGITLIEILIAAAMTALVMAGALQAYSYALVARTKMDAKRSASVVPAEFESTLRNLLENVSLSLETTDTSTYFIADDPAAGGQLGASSGSGTGASTLVFTTQAKPFERARFESQDEFETQNESFGPEGGTEEIALSLSPSGTPTGNGETEGVFLRRQSPSDGDTTQGGRERLLLANVVSLGFEFYDGTGWVSTWNSQSGQRRIPAAVRVTYRLQDEQNDRILVVRLKASDVTPETPLEQGA